MFPVCSVVVAFLHSHRHIKLYLLVRTSWLLLEHVIVSSPLHVYVSVSASDNMAVMLHHDTTAVLHVLVVLIVLNYSCSPFLLLTYVLSKLGPAMLPGVVIVFMDGVPGVAFAADVVRLALVVGTRHWRECGASEFKRSLPPSSVSFHFGTDLRGISWRTNEVQALGGQEMGHHCQGLRHGQIPMGK